MAVKMNQVLIVFTR